MAKSLYCLHSRRFGFRLSLQSKIFSNGYVNGSWGDYTQRPAVVPGVGEYLIYNTIYESNGYERTYARLGGFRAGGGTASGLWSPDSVGSYPHINP